MHEDFVQKYLQRLQELFNDTSQHLESRNFGAKSELIKQTLPLMTFEGAFEENPHFIPIPLLNELVKNIIISVAVSIFGWKKTFFLHLRVSFENLLNGCYLLLDEDKRIAFYSNQEIFYYKMNNLINYIVKYNATTISINYHFNLETNLNHLYHELSKWSHTLGHQYVVDLSILGYKELSNQDIGDLKHYLNQINRHSIILYLMLYPSIIRAFSYHDQKLILSSLSFDETRFLRNTLSI